MFQVSEFAFLFSDDRKKVIRFNGFKCVPQFHVTEPSKGYKVRVRVTLKYIELY